MRYCNRPGADVEEMNEILIANWNRVVGWEDEVWHLGDFAMGPSNRWEEYFFRLAGKRKYLIRGNHDSEKILRLPWDGIYDLHTFKSNKRSAVLCHYPLATWNRAHHGRWMLHGHSHGNMSPSLRNPTRMDVGVDTHPEFRPYHWDEIIAALADKEYKAVDHHDG